MEFPMEPDSINVFPADQFELARPRDPGELGVELMAQARPNGRIQDHFRIVIGGGAPLEFESSLGNFFGSDNARVRALRAQFHFWPRDLTLRRNATTSTWSDTYQHLAQKAAMLVDEEGAGVPMSEMATLVAGIEDISKKSSSFRWAVVIGEDGKPQLDLQTLPATEKYIAGKPALKRYEAI